MSTATTDMASLSYVCMCTATTAMCTATRAMCTATTNLFLANCYSSPLNISILSFPIRGDICRRVII